MKLARNKSGLDQVAPFLSENSLFLIGGSVAALVWANTNPESYNQLLHTSLLPGSNDEGYSLLHVVNDGLMALFFAMAAMEVWESLLPCGALSRRKTDATSPMATLGGVVMPACICVAGCSFFSEWETLGRGWTIPCATDTAFTYLIARLFSEPVIR